MVRDGLFLSWCVARCLLGGAATPVALPALAAVVMTAWDVVMDPTSSTIFGAWIWRHGGAYFGVPPLNFAGWLLTSWLFYQAFALYLRGRPLPATPRSLAIAAILFYLAAGLTYITPCLLAPGGTVADATGHVWRLGDIRWTSAVVMVMTMGLASGCASKKVALF